MTKVKVSKDLMELLIENFMFNLESTIVDIDDDEYEEIKKYFNEIKNLVDKNNLDVDIEDIDIYENDDDDYEEE